ncbi:MFS transporter [Eilatimonas milleporae]|uniref:EmrB/QacA subfamily drug resistance transporter n=1 Tax=Eilatimonas milleporae TaxID=911205 RepID=A0A3M0CLF2_9PROT|nr:MFS transporter [Eilatimonas milleporae]RMB07776.1 EmrB/QacA subfamily drug resistance transporter [Eilatimonas milleporae]
MDQSASEQTGPNQTGSGAAGPSGAPGGRISPATALHRPLCPDGHAALTPPCAQPCPERARPFVLAATILASAMAFIDGSIVTIALPAMQTDLAAGFDDMQWVVNAYALLLGSLILVGGGMGDRFGRRRVFVAVFALASLACALAPSTTALIAARGAQGVGAALLVPQSLAIIAAAFPRDARGHAIGIWAGASALTTALGPPLGGFLIDALDWRSVFWINLPLSAVSIWLALRYIPESRDDSAAGNTGGLDWTGAGLAVLAFGVLTVGLTRLAETGGSSLTAPLLVCAGLAGTAVFVLAEARAANPLMPLSLFRSAAFSGANLMTLFLYGALSGMLFLLPFDLIARRGMSASEVGLALLPVGLIIGTLSRAAGSLADRTGPRLPLTAGSLLVAGAAAGLAAGLSDIWIGVMAPLVALSAGMALVVAPLTTAVMNAAPDMQSGTASGVNNAASRLAGLFAVAIVGAVAAAVFTTAAADAVTAGDAATATTQIRFGQLPPPGTAGRAALEAAFLEAYGTAMRVTAVWGGLAALTALFFLRGDKALKE